MTYELISMIDFNKASKKEKQEFGYKVVNIFKKNGFLLLDNSYVSLNKQKELFAEIEFFF